MSPCYIVLFVFNFFIISIHFLYNFFHEHYSDTQCYVLRTINFENMLHVILYHMLYGPYSSCIENIKQKGSCKTDQIIFYLTSDFGE